MSSTDIRASLRCGDYTSLEAFKSECRFDPFLLEDSLQWAYRLCNRHILDYVLSKGVKPTSGSIVRAGVIPRISGILGPCTGNMEAVEFLVELLNGDPAKTKILTTALYILVVDGADEHVPFIKFLIAQGAHLKDISVVDRSITCGSFKIFRTLENHGAVFADRHVDIALYFGHFEAAYWMHQKGLRGVEEVPYEFLQYKATRDAERDAAARKIYFWILPKLYRNTDFVMRQAEKSYDNLFNSVDCST